MSLLCFCKISDWKLHWTDGFLKDLNRFFLSRKPRRSKNALYYQKNPTRKLFGYFKSWGAFHGDFEFGTTFIVILLWPSETQFLFKNAKKMKHPKSNRSLNQEFWVFCV